MNFELGKEYIVKVSEEGIIPIEEFDSDRFYDKDHDDLDFLTDEEKIVVINNVIDKIRAEIIKYEGDCRLSIDEYPSCKQCTDNVFETIYAILDKYKTESEEK